MKWPRLFSKSPASLTAAIERANCAALPGRMPDFLVIGAQKAGTTWLYDNLVGQNDFWMPPSKEIHYFDNLWPDSYLFASLRDRMDEELDRPNCNYDELLWRAKLAFVRPRDDAWYASLFAPAGDRLTGDITPAYSLLDEAAVSRIYALMPQTKIVFIMRDPVDRIWSHFCFTKSWTVKGMADTDLTDSFAIAEMDSTPYDLRTRYLRTLAIWEGHFPSGQILSLFYDDIVRNPRHFLEQLCRFLGTREPLQIDDNILNNRSNETFYVHRRPRVDRYFARKYRADLEALAKRFGGHPAKWLERATALTQNA